jgi:N-acetylmuramoyl-L-alanine amidase
MVVAGVGLVALVCLGVGIGALISTGGGGRTRIATSPAVSHRPPTTTAGRATGSTTPAPAATAAPATSTTAPASTTTTAAGGPLAGKVIAIDPGHDGGNAADPSYINAPIFNGRSTETCDTVGAETDAGYPEHQFNWQVANDLAADLEAQGAKVVLTRTSDTGVGPCVTQRAAIGNAAHADVAISIHADGGPADGRGFAVLEPVADGPNDAVIAPSDTFAVDLRNAFAAGTGEPVSSYDGTDGLQPRDDLGGLNLSTVPKVLIECANMRNATDAALLTTDAWQHQAAAAIAQGMITFLQ